MSSNTPNGKASSQHSQKSGRSSVIKHQNVIVKEPILINSATESNNGSLEVIRDGHLIIGVRYRCLCGRETEIYFEYEER